MGRVSDELRKLQRVVYERTVDNNKVLNLVADELRKLQYGVYEDKKGIDALVDQMEELKVRLNYTETIE